MSAMKSETCVISRRSWLWTASGLLLLPTATGCRGSAAAETTSGPPAGEVEVSPEGPWQLTPSSRPGGVRPPAARAITFAELMENDVLVITGNPLQVASRVSESGTLGLDKDGIASATELEVLNYENSAAVGSASLRFDLLQPDRTVIRFELRGVFTEESSTLEQVITLLSAESEPEYTELSVFLLVKID